MNDFIKSFEKRLVAFDQETIARDLLIKENNEKLKIDNYWNNFKCFKQEFERLIYADLKKLYNALKPPLMQRNLLIKIETHKKIGRKYFSAKHSVYALISICDRSTILVKRWQTSPFLLLVGDFQKKTITLYDCNQELISSQVFLRNDVLDNPLEQFLINEYNFTLLEPHIDKWLNRNLDRILESKNYISNNNII